MSYIYDTSYYEDTYDISGYTLNGIFFGSLRGHFNNFYTTKNGE